MSSCSIRVLSVLIGILTVPKAACRAFGRPVADTLAVSPFTPVKDLSGISQLISLDFLPASGAVFLSPDPAQFAVLNQEAPQSTFALSLPVAEQRMLVVDVAQVTFLSPEFVVTTGSGKALDVPSLRFYRGRVRGDATSTVALVSTPDGLQGLLYGEGFSYTLGKVRPLALTGTHVVYPSDALPDPARFLCQPEVPLPPTPTLPGVSPPRPPGGGRLAAVGSRKVGIYLETDYQLYLDWGSNASFVVSQVGSIFSNVASLYADESVPIELSELKVWDVADPYGSPQTAGAALNAFRIYWNGRGDSFNGDIAHLLSSKNLGGGIAYYVLRENPAEALEDVASVFYQSFGRQYAYGVSGNITNNSTPLPAYSWNVKVVSHEIGHNFGLPHTHSCLWNGGALDNCAAPEGSCAPGPPPPGGKGTIMSYCSTDLAKGFAEQPSSKLKYEFLAGRNLSSPGGNPPVVTPSGATLVRGQSVSVTVSNCSGTVMWSDGQITGLTRTLSPDASTVYRAACLTDGYVSSVTEVPIVLTCVEPLACVPTAPGGNSLYFGIASFTLDSISTDDYYGSPANLGTHYEDLTCDQSTTLKTDSTYSFSLSVTYGNPAHARVYVDFNANGSFADSGELVYQSTSSTSSHSAPFTVPPHAATGRLLRMRVMVDPNSALTSCNLPGTVDGSGKANDYALRIQATPCPPGPVQTVRSGDWNDPSVWSCGVVPTATDPVVILASHTVTLPGGYVGDAYSVELRGSLGYGTNAVLRLNHTV